MCHVSPLNSFKEREKASRAVVVGSSPSRAEHSRLRYVAAAGSSRGKRILEQMRGINFKICNPVLNVSCGTFLLATLNR